MEHVLKEISFDLLYPRAAVSVDMGQGRDRLRGVTTYAGSTFYSIIIFNTIRKHQIKYPNFGQKKKKNFFERLQCIYNSSHPDFYDQVPLKNSQKGIQESKEHSYSSEDPKHNSAMVQTWLIKNWSHLMEHRTTSCLKRL